MDLERRTASQAVDWAEHDIEWHGDGGERGLRGIAFDNDRILVASSNSLLSFSTDFRLQESWTNPYLKYAHGIFVWQRMLYVTSAGFDCVLGFDLDENRFTWAMHVRSVRNRFQPNGFDPNSDDGPLLLQKLHLNNVYCDENGMYLTGLHAKGMLHFNGKDMNMSVLLPAHSRDARPFRDGVIFNDGQDAVLRYTGRGEGEEDRAMALPKNSTGEFARGLCVLGETIVAGGASPAAVAFYDLAANAMVGSIELSRDANSSVHSIARWPFD